MLHTILSRPQKIQVQVTLFVPIGRLALLYKKSTEIIKPASVISGIFFYEQLQVAPFPSFITDAFLIPPEITITLLLK